MPIVGPLDYLPLWGVFAATTLLFLFGAETGFFLGSYKQRCSGVADKAPVDQIVAATVGLLALLLAFTFNLAAARFDTRRDLVLREANAIGTTWLRAGLLAEPDRTEIRRQLRDYLEVRLAIVQFGDVQKGIQRAEELQHGLWAAATAVGQKQPGSIMAGLFINSLNEVIDLHAERVTFAYQTRIPVMIWAALYFVGLLAIGSIGYQSGVMGARRSLFILSVVLSSSAVLFLIADLDRPQEGLSRISQQALVDLRKMMK